MNNTDRKRPIINYLKARYPILAIESFEEERAIVEIQKMAQEIHHELYVWNSTDGVKQNGKEAGTKTNDLKAAIDFCVSRATRASSSSAMPTAICRARPTMPSIAAV